MQLVNQCVYGSLIIHGNADDRKEYLCYVEEISVFKKSSAVHIYITLRPGVPHILALSTGKLCCYEFSGKVIGSEGRMGGI